MNTKPNLAIIQGDPAGIGPELLIKLLTDSEVRERANIVVVGAPEVFQRGQDTVGETVECDHVLEFDADALQESGLLHLDLSIEGIGNVPQSTVSESGGQSSITGLHTAFELFSNGSVQGVCFMPFNKESMHLGGNEFTDELGFARHFFGTKNRVSEFNVAHGMWNGRVTSHVPMKDVPALLSKEKICEAIDLANTTLRNAGYERPRIVVAGYNPHAGDGGLLGMEEIEIIQPAVKAMQERQMAVTGPLPADTLWLKVRDGEYDCVVTMYHDQGQIAIKLLGFDQGVSVLAGLPVPLATPAHGTAFDIAGQNKANVVPAKNAFMMVCDMAGRTAD